MNYKKSGLTTEAGLGMKVGELTGEKELQN